MTEQQDRDVEINDDSEQSDAAHQIRSRHPAGPGVSDREDGVLKDDHERSTCGDMMVKLIRSVLAMLVAVALTGVPAVQAAVAMPCDPIIMSATDHQPSSSPAPVAPPGKEKMPGCADLLGGGIGVALHVRTPARINRSVWTATAYWPATESFEGLSIKPDLGPPITI